VNLALAGNAAITGKPSWDQNIENMTYVMDGIVLGRNRAITPPESDIRS
jgi:hypothetical protein